MPRPSCGPSRQAARHPHPDPAAPLPKARADDAALSTGCVFPHSLSGSVFISVLMPKRYCHSNDHKTAFKAQARSTVHAKAKL